MAERVRCAMKAEAARELEVSISTLDRKIRRGEVETRREGRRVYGRMEGPERVSEEELLRRALGREGKFRRRLMELDQRAQTLERDEAVYAAYADRQAYEEMEGEENEKDRTARIRTRRLVIRFGLAAVALLVVIGLRIWRLDA